MSCPIPPEDLSRQLCPPDGQRREIKCLITQSQYHHLLHVLRVHSAGFTQAYETRRVNNIYFDTYVYRSYDDNLSGVSRRNKVRFRWYGEKPWPSSGTLEIKCKQNQFGWKYSYPIASLETDASESWVVFKQKLARALTPEGKLWLDTYPMPVLINRYDRDYYVSADQTIRVTLDYNQEVLDQRHMAYPNLSYRRDLSYAVVIEIKFHVDHQEKAVQILDGLPVRIGRHSKYVSGLCSLS